jgi:hypothetical protein
MRPLSPTARAAAWLMTGPVGHLASGLADWAVLLWRLANARARGKSLGG